MKIRVLYPTAIDAHLDEPSAAGDIVDVADDLGKALIDTGSAELPEPAKVERATKAPGEKRGPGRPRKKPAEG